MSLSLPARTVGDLLRAWRKHRRLSQLDLGAEAAVSARHLSFVETGRSLPSRALLLHLAERLDVPLRDRNGLLLAAGYAPTYQETALDAPDMARVRDGIEKILSGHEPFPAIVVDRRFDLVSSNDTAMAILADGVAPELLAPPANVLRASLHPNGLASRIVNFAEWSSHIIDRVQRQADACGDGDLMSLHNELRQYTSATDTVPQHGTSLYVPLVLRLTDDRQLRFFSTLATFGTAVDITIAELAIESFFPADEKTATYLGARRRTAPSPDRDS